MVQKTVQLDDIADTHTLKIRPDENNVNAVEMLIGGGYGDNDWANSHAWLKFDALPSDFELSNLTSATLKLYVTSYNIEDTIRFGFQRPNAPWDENIITWNNHPTLQEGFKSEDKYMNYEGWYEFQFTKTEFENCINASNQPDMRIACNVYNPGRVCSIISKDHSAEWARPRIILTYETPSKKSTTMTVYDGEINAGDQLFVAANLTEGVYPYTPVLNRMIDFDIDGTYVCSGMTNSVGDAYCDTGAYGKSLAPGYYTITGAFAGDVSYEESSSSNTLTVNAELTCPAPEFDSVNIDNSPVVGVETTISWTIEAQPSEVMYTEYGVYIFNNTKSEQYYDDIVDDTSLPITYPLDSVGDDITVEVSAVNWCGDNSSEPTVHEETVYPIEETECVTPIISSVFYTPNPPFAGSPFEIDISVSNPQDSVYYEYALVDASIPFSLPGTSGFGYGDSTFHDEITIPEEHAEVEAYLVINATNICGDTESEPAIWTSPNFTIIGVACKLHFVLFKPTRYLEENTDLVFEGKLPNVLPDIATAKITFIKPDLTTFDHIIEDIESCTQNDFSITFPYSESLYGNWIARVYNDDIPIAPPIYIQIQTEEDWGREESIKNIMLLVSILGAGVIAYILVGGE